MKSKMFFRKALSVMMAAVVSATTVFPVYAADTGEQNPVTEADTDQTETVAESEAATETVTTDSPKEESKTDLQNAATKGSTEELETSALYALCLPKMDDVRYSYEKDHLYKELSDSTMDVLVYEAGEHVDVTVKTDCPFTVVDGYTEEVFLSEDDISDGNLSFSMPETDLILQFKGEKISLDETEESTEKEKHSENAETQGTELSDETDVLQSEDVSIEPETETELQSETASEAETESELQSETVKNIQTEAITEDTEAMTEDIPEAEEDIRNSLYPELGSTVQVSSQNVYCKDKGFDYKSYVPEVDGLENAVISWEKGELNFDQEGTYDIIYRVSLKDDSGYFWFVDIPMEVVSEKDAATATSNDFDNKIFLNKEQSDEFTGKVPENNGDHVAGPDIETVRGENFKLKDVNLGYDMNIFVYDVYDDGGFDPNKTGTYHIVYAVTSYQTPDVEFYVDCNVTVKENMENEKAMSVHIISTELKADIVDTDGNSYEAAYGSDAVLNKNIKNIIVKPAWQGETEIEPVITVLKNGAVSEGNTIIKSEEKVGSDYVATLDETIDISNDKYVFIIDYPSFDPLKNGLQKSEDRRTDDYVDPVEELEDDDEYGIATCAATSDVSKTWTGLSNKSSVSNGRNSCTNYGWISQFTGYRRYTLNFSASFKKNLDDWVAEQGADFTGKVPDSVTIQCAEGGGTHMAWNGFCGKSLSITATIKHNSAGDPTRLVIKVNAPGKSTGQGNYQRYSGSKTVPLQPATGEVKIVKTSLGKFVMQFDNVNLLAKFTLYTDAECTDEYDSIRLVPDEDSSAKATATITEIEPGKYWLKETRIAEGHRDDGKVYPVTVENGETSVLNISNTPYFFNGQFLAKKTSDTNAPLAGAVFKVTGTCDKKNLGTWYFKTDSNGAIKYDENHYLTTWNGKKSSALTEYGVASVKYALPKDTTLTMVEVEAPDGYRLDSKEYTTTTKVNAATDAHLVCNVVTVKNTPDQGKLVIHKEDADLGASVPNTKEYSLAGAKFSVKDEKGKEVAVLTTDDKGKSNEVTLKTGTYTVQETKNPRGYKINSKAVKVTVNLNQTTTTVVKDEPKKGSLDIHKKLDPEEPDAIKQKRDLTKITFRLSYKMANGKIIYAKDANGSTNLHPDKKGNLHISDLYYGTWTLTELNSVVYHELMEPEEIEISSTDTSAVDYSVDNYRYKCLLEVVKKDLDTGKVIPRAGCTFRIKDEAGNYISLDVDNSGKKTKDFVTSKEGHVDVYEKIPAGKYTLVETVPPAGYKLANPVNFEVTGKEATVTVEMHDKRVSTGISIEKKDSSTGNSAGAGFEFNIVTDENITDASGTVYKGFKAGTVVDKIVTDKSGIAKSNVQLYPGNYHIEEAKTATNYLNDAGKVTFKIAEKKVNGTWVAEVENFDGKVISIKDSPVMRPIQVRKTDSISNNAAGAKFEFTITAQNVVDGSGNVRKGYEKGTLVDTIITDNKGIATSKNLYCGTYVVKETVRKENYVLSTKEYSVTVKDENKTATPVIVNIKDAPVKKKVKLTKIDEVSGNHCGSGFKFQIIVAEDVLDGSGTVYAGYKTGDVVDTITTDESGIAISKELFMGKYYIQEVEVPNNGGMHINPTKYPFTLSDDISQNVKDTDKVIVLPIEDIADKPIMRPIQVQKTDSVSNNAAGAKFEFTITAENVVDGSGKVREGYEKGTLIDTITTDERGIATSKDLYCGTYIVRETIRKENYVLSTKEYPVTVTDEKQTTEPVIVNIKDKPVTQKIKVTKIDEVTGNHCGAGFVFQITAAEDILDGAGVAYEGYKAGDVVDTITTDELGIAISKELFMGKYYIQEIEVSDDGGMAINQTKYPFTLSDDISREVKDTDEILVVPINDIADKPTTVTIKKLDALLDKDGNPITGDDGQPREDAEPKMLEGITFRVKAKDAEDSDEQLYVTDKDGNIKIEYLKKNTVYTIQETATIPGYNLDETVSEFAVDDKGLINGESSYSVTFTNIPNVVHISKIDITNSKEISGAKMELTDMDGNVIDEWTSEEKPHVIYGLADGQYRLVESVAPEKYEVATSVSQSNMPLDETEKTNIDGLNSEGIFTVKDSTVIQQIVMKDSPYRWVDISKKEITGDDELPGCTLTVRDAHGDVVDTWVSTTEAHRLQLHSGVYTLTEEKPAEGYVTADTVKFEIVQTSETDYDVQTVAMRDEVTKITISKKDITNGEELPGAHLVIKNEAGDVVEEWTSTNETHYVEKMPIGKYTLTEITAPEGYEVAETINFEIKDTGDIQHYEMFDSPYRPVEVSKKDITNKEELPGAALEIRDADNNVVDSWTSTSEVHMVSLPHGKYTLIETKPADGFVTAESINFEVLVRNTPEEDGVEIQHVEMEDDVTKVQISKQDVTTKKELPGAKLQIKDKDGNVIEEWTSTNEVHYIEKLPIGEYTLVETTAPNGYDVAESVNFKVLDTNEIQHVIMYDSPTVNTSTPKTGDINQLVPIVVGIIVVIFAGAGVILVRGKKKKSK